MLSCMCFPHLSKISDLSPNFVSDDLCFVLNQHTILDWCSATFCFWWSLFCTEPTHCFLIGVVLHFVSDDLCFVLDQHTVLDWCSATFFFVAHWNNSPRVDMLFYLHTLSWIWVKFNPSMIFLPNTACLVKTRQI